LNHQPPNGGQPRDSPGGSSFGGDLPRKPPFNPFVGSFGWPRPNLRMFIPPWYQPPIVQCVSKPTIKLAYKKLQYPTYVKDTDSDAHIRVLKKAIKANGETMEVDIINLFGFTFNNNIFEQGKIFIQDHPNCTLEELEQAYCK
jgi:hypothetical protein